MPSDGIESPRIGTILKLALPIVISRASYTAMLFVDRLMLSRVGKHELAAAMSGGLSSFVLSSFFVGLIGYATALVAQYYGAQQKTRCTQAVTQAIYVGIASYPILLAFVPIVRFLFIATRQDPALAELATSYARILLFGSLFLVVRTAVGSFFIGIGKTRVVMIANVLGAVVNIPLNYILIFGKLGIPALGIRGAAIGTVCGSFFVFVLLFWQYVRETAKDTYKTPQRWHLSWDIMRRLLRFGIPAGIEPFLNWFAFTIFVQIMHSYGPDTAAAATIAFNWDAVAFIPMLGLGVAATTFAGQYIGAKDTEGAEKAIGLILRIGFMYSLVMITLFVGFGGKLTEVFSRGFSDPHGSIAEMSTVMLRMLALYTIANSAKLSLIGSLRAAGDTTWVMWVSIAIHWAMAIAVILLVRVVGANRYLSWSTLIMMNNAHALSVWYRYKTGKWKKIRLID